MTAVIIAKEASGLVGRLVSTLQHLSRVNYQDSVAERVPENAVQRAAEDVLHAVFRNGLAREHVPEEMRCKVASLISDSLLAIESCVNNHIRHMSDDIPLPSRYHQSCIIRSGVQFLLDDYRGLHTHDGELLAVTFVYLDHHLDLREFDRKLDNYWPTSYDNEYHAPPTHPDILRKVPKSHWWWF